MAVDQKKINMASSRFEQEIMHILAGDIEGQAGSVTTVISGTKRPPSDRFMVLQSKIYKIELGQVTVFFQEKADSNYRQAAPICQYILLF